MIIFRYVCLLYINMLHVVSLGFIVLPQTYPIRCVVEQNVKVDVKISSVHRHLI